MSRLIRTADDVAWLLEHTHAFQGGQVMELYVRKQRLFDETTGREVPATTIITAIIRYELLTGDAAPHTVTRVAKLTMTGVTDFSIFEQEGADFSEIGVIHAELSCDRLRFWFDPQGELYVICDQAEIEEVSRPGADRPIPAGAMEWTFQAQTGELPPVAWFLDHLDRAGLPCAWRPTKRAARPHPALRWEGHLMLASAQGIPRAGGIFIQTYGPLDGCGFGLTVRASDTHENGIGHLLTVLADIVVRSFSGRCLVGSHIMEREEWLERRAVVWGSASRGITSDTPADAAEPVRRPGS